MGHKKSKNVVKEWSLRSFVDKCPLGHLENALILSAQRIFFSCCTSKKMEESKTKLLHHMVEIVNFCPKIMVPFVRSKKLNNDTI